MMRPTIKRAAFAAAMALLFSGCADQEAGSSDLQTFDLPTWCTTGPCLGVPADVPRTAIVHSAGRCVSVDIDGGRAAVLWPRLYVATFGPFRAYDEHGRLVAEDGHELRTIILGPFPTEKDSCGLTRTVQLYFAPEFLGSPTAT